MDNKKSEEKGFFEGVKQAAKAEIERRKGDTGAIVCDAIVFLISFLFSRCHIAFGVYPLGLSFIAVLPSGVWIALLGAVLGSVSLGRLGVIHAIISIIVVFLRLIISGGKEDQRTFGEPLILRMSSAAVGAFVGAVYEILLSGFGVTSVLYGLFGVLLSAVFTFCLSGIFDGGVGFRDLVSGQRDIFSHAKNKDKFGIYLFQGSFLLFVFLISLSLKQFDILGVSPAYMFASLMTLLVARRFGIFRAMAVGFAAALPLSGLYSVAFALLGLGAGLLFPVGIAYAILAGGVLLSVWGFYSAGLVGFLSLFPEYSAAALISMPLLRKLKRLNESTVPESENQDASGMVATTALGYKTSGVHGLDGLENALFGLSGALRSFGDGEGRVSLSEYHDLVIECAREFCSTCPRADVCISENPAPCAENMDLIATKLYKKQRIFPDDASIVPRYCKNSAALFERIVSEAGRLEGERYKDRRMEGYAEECELFSKLINESRAQNERECSVDPALSEKLADVFMSAGIRGGVIRAFGERHKYFIGAGEDKDGRIITSPELRRGIEDVAGVRLGTPEYYRKGDIALFECPTAPMYTVEFAAAGRAISALEVSGDTAVSFESENGYFYSLISDGMGSGEAAHKTSLFTADFLSRILGSSCSKATALRLLNHIIRGKGEECSATVDLFEFDLYSGEAVFFKCGAAPSYVKRDGSIFRIRSETAPVGLMKSIDAERIRVEVLSGDYIIMLSDGVSQAPEDSVWLLELLSKPPRSDIRDYAEYILEAARENAKCYDDMSVAVARIMKVGEEKRTA